MTIEQLGSLGEFIASLATLVTLVYLAVQIRSNTAALRTESRRSLGDDGRAFILNASSSTENARVLRLGAAGSDELNEDERMQFFLQFSLLMTQVENTYSDLQVGLVGDAYFESRAVIVRQILAGPGGVSWWQAFAATLSQPVKEYFLSEVPGLRAKVAAAPDVE